MKKIIILIIIPALASCTQETTDNGKTASEDIFLIHEGEKHFKNIRQLTFGGDNAEAYWSFDDSKLIFQSNFTEWGVECDQIFFTNWQNDKLENNQPKMISTGKGRTTCAYFLPGDSTFLYSSTHLADKECPPVPGHREDGKYVWKIYSGFDIFKANIKGEIIAQLTDSPGYDAEATISPLGDKIVFTSMRTGDLELFVMNIDGTGITQITDEIGYDGGAFFSSDGSQIIFRASRPKTEEEIEEYQSLLAEELVMPTKMELFICNSDGSSLRQLTNLGGANWCPFFNPSGEKVIFASNYENERGFPFNLYMINTDGTGLEKITADGTFDAFPVFSNDGKRLVFSSNRNNNGTRDTNLFVVEWVD